MQGFHTKQHSTAPALFLYVQCSFRHLKSPRASFSSQLCSELLFQSIFQSVLLTLLSHGAILSCCLAQPVTNFNSSFVESLLLTRIFSYTSAHVKESLQTKPSCCFFFLLPVSNKIFYLQINRFAFFFPISVILVQLTSAPSPVLTSNPRSSGWQGTALWNKLEFQSRKGKLGISHALSLQQCKAAMTGI